MTNISTSTYRLGGPVVAARPRVNPIAGARHLSNVWHVVARPVSFITTRFGTMGDFCTVGGASTKRHTRPLGFST